MKYLGAACYVMLIILSDSIAQQGVVWPVGPLGKQHHTRTIYNNYGDFHGTWHGCVEGGYNFHAGIDILPYNNNTEVLAAREGYISHIDQGIGPQSDEWFVVIVEDLNTSTHGWCYSHLTEPDWVVGAFVECGDKLADMADMEGYSNTHLHFSWSQKEYSSADGSTINPLDYLTTNNLEWVWNRRGNSDNLFIVEDQPISEWPEPPFFLPGIALQSNDVHGDVDVLYSYCLEGIGHIGNALGVLPLNPEKMQWALYSSDMSTKYFTKYVVDFSGKLGVVPENNEAFMSHYYSISRLNQSGSSAMGLITCLTNCIWSAGFPDPGISNIAESSWNTLWDWEASKSVFVPTDAMTPDGGYRIIVTSTAHDGTPHDYQENIILDNFYPYIQSIVVNNGAYSPPPIYEYDVITPIDAIPRIDTRIVNESYTKRVGSMKLEVEILFSEPVIVNDISIEAVAGDQTLWVSEMQETTASSADGGQQSYSYITEDPAPHGYIGKMILHIDAVDLGFRSNSLDTNPETIPFPYSKNAGNDTNYEEGVAQIQWNIVPFVSLNRGNGIVTGRLSYYGTVMYTLDVQEVFSDPSARFSFLTPITTEGPSLDLIDYEEGLRALPRRGFCERYSGFWLYPYGAGLWVQEPYYDKVYICMPDVSKTSGWAHVEFQFPFQYGSHPNGVYDSHERIMGNGDFSLADIVDNRDAQFANQSYSCIHGSRVTYSDGNYLFVLWWDYDYDEDEYSSRLTCISAISAEMRHLNLPGNSTVTWHNPQPDGDWVGITHGSETYYYHPYSPEFFEDENPYPEIRYRKYISEEDAYMDHNSNEYDTSELLWEDSDIVISSISPNPVSFCASFCINSVSTGNADIAIYDVVGRRTADIGTKLNAGPNTFNWQIPRSMGNGIYFLRVAMNGQIIYSRMTIAR